MKRKSDSKEWTRTGVNKTAFEELYEDLTILNHLAKKSQMKIKVVTCEVLHMQGKKVLTTVMDHCNFH